MSDRTASTALPPGFRRDDGDAGLPAAGLVLLAVLAVAALAAWCWQAWQRRTGGTRPTPGAAATATATLRTVESRLLANGSRLHVVAWQGRHYLLATSAHGAPVLIDRQLDGATPASSERASP